MTRPVLKACLFDLDGVIVDTAKYHYLAWRQLARDLGFDFSEADNERLKGVSRMRSLDILLEIGGIRLPQDEKERVAAEKNALYRSYILKMTPDEILPGAHGFVAECRARGIRTALGTASKNADTILTLLGIADLFDAVIDGNKALKAKPDPEVFLMGAEELAVAPESCAVFEDAEAGIEAAHAAGMFAVGIGRSGTLRQADLLAPGLAALSLDAVMTAYGRAEQRRVAVP